MTAASCPALSPDVWIGIIIGVSLVCALVVIAAAVLIWNIMRNW